jgi:hypothetical protein
MGPWRRDPVQTSSDYAAGIVGFFWLAVGFILQALPLANVDAHPSKHAVLCGVLVGFVGGGLLVWLVYEVLRWRLLPGENAMIEKHNTRLPRQPLPLGKLVLSPGSGQGRFWAFHLWNTPKP